MSAAMASWAARLISSGAEKSGKPCARLIAPCSIAWRVISRMTDSVNNPAFSLTSRFTRDDGTELMEIERSTARGRRSLQPQRDHRIDRSRAPRGNQAGDYGHQNDPNQGKDKGG